MQKLGTLNLICMYDIKLKYFILNMTFLTFLEYRMYTNFIMHLWIKFKASVYKKKIQYKYVH